MHAFANFVVNQVEYLTDTHEDAHRRGDHHKDGEDFLLCRTGDVAVDSIWARRFSAFGNIWHVEMINVVQNIEEACIEASFEQQAEYVGVPQASTLLPRVGVQVFTVMESGVLLILHLTILDVNHHHERWARDENDLQGP